MGAHIFTNYYQAAAVLLFGIGLTILFIDRNLVKKIVGMNIASNGLYLFLASMGYVTGRRAPIIVEGVQDMTAYINPIPTGLILTGIVISVSFTAFGLAIIVMLYEHYGTLDLDEIVKLVACEETGDGTPAVTDAPGDETVRLERG